jgi:excisionase family DNA binding protein
MHQEPISPFQVERAERISGSATGRISVPEIAQRLSVGRLAVYAMLEQGILPAIKLGRRWLITRHAYEAWERTCGIGFQGRLGGSV